MLTPNPGTIRTPTNNIGFAVPFIQMSPIMLHGRSLPPPTLMLMSASLRLKNSGKASLTTMHVEAESTSQRSGLYSSPLHPLALTKSIVAEVQSAVLFA